MAKEAITLYSLPDCVQCMMTAKQFDKLKIEYTKVDLADHPDLVETFKEQGLMSAPIITTSQGNWSGFRIDKIRDLAHRLFGEQHHG